MIISGGENVYPAEVEAALRSHPAVADAAVIGIPDARWGEAVHAVVVLQRVARGSERRRCATSCVAWCRRQLAGYKCPRSIEFSDALPLSAAGKVLKNQLRARYRRRTQHEADAAAEARRHAFAGVPFTRLLGVRREFSEGGRARLVVDARPELENVIGAMHGGVRRDAARRGDGQRRGVEGRFRDDRRDADDEHQLPASPAAAGSPPTARCSRVDDARRAVPGQRRRRGAAAWSRAASARSATCRTAERFQGDTA